MHNKKEYLNHFEYCLIYTSVMLVTYAGLENVPAYLLHSANCFSNFSAGI